MDKLDAGTYIVAVSGGVDSITLLNMLSKVKNLDLIVAHFNHGIREDSDNDEKFVKNLAKNYSLKFISKKGKLGRSASEDDARKARYVFLDNVKREYLAKAIVTAHHQDDLIETAIINITRGTNRRGLTSLKSTPNLARPLLNMTKKQIINYAKANNLRWLDDPTNIDKKYLRNKIRLEIMPIINADELLRHELLKIIQSSQKVNHKLDIETANLSQKILSMNNNRAFFTLLPSTIANEVSAEMLRINGAKNINKRTITDLTTNIKTGKTDNIFDLGDGLRLVIKKQKFMFVKSR